MNQKNVKALKDRMEAGLARLRQHYAVNEKACGEFQEMQIGGRAFHVKQYEVCGVGNLLIMTSTDEGEMQLDTFTLTPFCKNLPMFTTDYMYMGEKRICLQEFYDLVAEKDAVYQEYLARFAENNRLCAEYPDVPAKPAWFDALRPVMFCKSTMVEQDERMQQIFLQNLDTYIEMEKALPQLDAGGCAEKRKLTEEYAKHLAAEGGISTQMFVKEMGVEKTERFFTKVFFGTDC